MIFQREDFAEKIYGLSILQQNYVKEHLKGLDLSSVQSRSLIFIQKNPGTMQRDLAGYLGKQQATVTNVLKSLESLQLIERKIPKENERQKNIYLTKKGEQKAKEVQAIFEGLAEKINQIFSQEELAVLNAGLDRAREQFIQ